MVLRRSHENVAVWGGRTPARHYAAFGRSTGKARSVLNARSSAFFTSLERSLVGRGFDSCLGIALGNEFQVHEVEVELQFFVCQHLCCRDHRGVVDIDDD